MTSLTIPGRLQILSLALLAACSLGESTNRPDRGAQSVGGSPASPANYTLAAGTRIDAVITSTISSRHARAGDRFSAEVASDVLTRSGRVAIPAGSAVVGTITDVSAAANSRSSGTLTLGVTGLTVRGRSVELSATIDSLDTQREGRGIEEVDAARVAGGAAAGAILGRVIGGNSRGTVIGGVVGGAAGAAVSAVMKDVDIVLPAGSRLMLTLSERLSVPATR